MKIKQFNFLISFLIFWVILSLNLYSQKAENLIIFTTDGLRWQEVFGGIDSIIARDSKFTKNPNEIFSKYFDKNLEIRRQKLMPFIWSKIASEGIIIGNRWNHSFMDVENDYWFSYPGYNEMLTGYADSSINSNDKNPNKNVTILEYLNNQKAFKGKVAAFTTWDVFPYIINADRSGVLVNSGHDLMSGELNQTQKLLNDIQVLAPKGHAERHDFLTYFQAREYLKKHQPKVLYISLDDTDGFAHAGQYDDYIEAAHAFDNYLKDIWDIVQSLPNYKNKTTLLITTDHGRGDIVKSEWTSHGIKIKGASQIWAAAIGPNIIQAGVINDKNRYSQSQIAATAAEVLGYKFIKDDNKPQKTISEPLPIFR